MEKETARIRTLLNIKWLVLIAMGLIGVSVSLFFFSFPGKHAPGAPLIHLSAPEQAGLLILIGFIVSLFYLLNWITRRAVTGYCKQMNARALHLPDDFRENLFFYSIQLDLQLRDPRTSEDESLLQFLNREVTIKGRKKPERN